jgi:3-methyladenine DNA glycosylase AlkD
VGHQQESIMVRARNTDKAAAFVRAVVTALAPLADADRSAGMKAYMRGQFDYLGIPTPARRAASAPLIRGFAPASADELRAAAFALWAKHEREYQYVAVDLLARHAKALALADVEWLLELVAAKSWWDTVDALAKVVGSLVRGGGAAGKRRMDRAVKARNLWVRRIAVLHQLGWRQATDTEQLFAYARLLAAEEEFFIRKAIGWALRDYAWHNWGAVEDFLHTDGAALAPLSVREARKNFPELKLQKKKRAPHA